MNEGKGFGSLMSPGFSKTSLIAADVSPRVLKSVRAPISGYTSTMRWRHIDFESAMRRVADRKIEEAMREGKFDNLPGKGLPLELEPIPTAENARMTWWALKILRNNDFTPEEVVWRKGIDHLRERLGKASSESVVCQIVDQINDLVRRINTLGTNAINLPVAPMSRETALEQFRLTAMPAREEGAGSCHFGSAREE